MSLHLIIGANASGKSHYAEKKASASWLLSSGKGGLIYLATMLSGKDDETQKRIRRHRERRAGMGFLSLECPYPYVLEDILESEDFYLPDSVLLLEDLTNLFANVSFPPESFQGQDMESTATGILDILFRVDAMCSDLFIVMNSIFSDGFQYPEETEVFLYYLSWLHKNLSARSLDVTEIVCGIPVFLKREHM